jgi:hypothetical protein
MINLKYIESYQKDAFSRYPALFHKYLLNLRDPTAPIKYNVVKFPKIDRKYICSIHCYDLSKFEIMFEDYLDKIGKYFSILVTFVKKDESILEKYTEYTFIEMPNYGMDIGSKFITMDFLSKNNISHYKYIFFIHSKTNTERRREYMTPYMNNMSKIIPFLKKHENTIGGIFNHLIHYRKNTFFFNPLEELNELIDGKIKQEGLFDINMIDWGVNEEYMTDILKYMNLPNNYLFNEGNFYILKKCIAETLFSDIWLYNILNTETSFDYNWVKQYYLYLDSIYNDPEKIVDEVMEDIICSCEYPINSYIYDKNIDNPKIKQFRMIDIKDDYETVYQKYINNELYGNHLDAIEKTDESMADGMIEHVFERLVNIVILNEGFKIKLIGMESNPHLKDLNVIINH